ncbi:hypothetical protein BJF83_22440 [Nocardiopsis sp. CNR-923]|uniref:hypothetical protein n=1 Tax=Nocardiopsis sp. CNR-923 TaxID=1904965 RepID=UPI00095F2D98|nr:hypothetical protein [Nocardiopsis sp. CNR-923]OLT25843.1 hypothetical protein BJF83_22440 [Nocardiopsis sp. CNR-923]
MSAAEQARPKVTVHEEHAVCGRAVLHSTGRVELTATRFDDVEDFAVFVGECQALLEAARALRAAPTFDGRS